MTEEIKAPSALSQLRELVPPRPLTPGEVRQLVERQATRLLKIMGIEGPPVPIEQMLGDLPRMEVKRFAPLPSSGRTQWAGGRWVILVAEDEPKVRQRYSMAHELAHAVYHPLAGCLPATKTATEEQRLEQLCELFAANLLMPRLWIKRAYYDDRIQDVPSLSRLFGVSWVAMRVRLEQLGLVTEPGRAA